MRAIAIDDEPIALELLSAYASKIPFLELQAVYTDPFEAMAHLKREPVDLLFLDIQMPDLTGFQFLQTLQTTPPALIFTTAYRDYGLEGFNHDAVDYLLKPYHFDRFTKAVNKAQEWLNSKTATTTPPEPSPFIFVKSEHQLVKVMLQDILWLEAWGDYVKIFTQPEKPLLTLTSLQTFASALPDQSFIRVHRSYIVHTAHISMIQKNRIFIGEKVIPVGEAYTNAFYDKLPGV